MKKTNKNPKKAHTVEEEGFVNQKFITPLNYLPIAIEHSEEFCWQRDNMDKDARDRVQRINPDDLNVDFFDPVIDVDTANEIHLGKGKHTSNIRTIHSLLEDTKEFLYRSQLLLEQLNADREELLSKKQKYLDLKETEAEENRK